MNRSKYILSVIPIAILTLLSCQQKKEPDYKKVSKETELSDSVYVKRGEYIVNSIGCGDCHSPKRMGAHGPEVIPELLLSGFQQENTFPEVPDNLISQGMAVMNSDLTAAKGSWGISYAANLTPADNGIGNWTLDQFKRALREGKSKGMENGRMILPPMPWQNFKNLTDDDIKAIFSYLKSLPPVDNAVPGPVPPANLGTPKTARTAKS